MLLLKWRADSKSLKWFLDIALDIAVFSTLEEFFQYIFLQGQL